MTGYFQSVTVGVAPIVVVIASVATFSTHLLLGYNLTAAQVSNTQHSRIKSPSSPDVGKQESLFHRSTNYDSQL